MNQTAKTLAELSIMGILITEDFLTAHISDGREVSIPIAWFPRLMDAKPDQLAKYEISPSGYGIHWPDIDEDISIRSFISP
jgi:hypothetical protein